MPVKNIVRGQQVSAKQLDNAKHLRREMTPAEKILWEQLKANRLNGLHFRRQQIVHGSFADFYCHRLELIVWIDGSIHELQQEYDTERAHYSITNDEIMKNLKGVLRKIVEACKRT